MRIKRVLAMLLAPVVVRVATPMFRSKRAFKLSGTRGLVASSGRFTAIRRYPDGFFATYIEDGKSPLAGLRVNIFRIHWDDDLKGWTFYD
jgi:hypothetical protein